MLRYDFEKSVGYWICSASHAFERAMDVELRPHGVTFRQCQVLGVLALHGPQSQSEMAAHMGIEPPTLTGVLERMERDAWIGRAPCSDDRRKKIVSPLAQAEPVWDRIVAAAQRVRARAMQDFSDLEKEALRDALARIRANLEGHVARETER